MIILSQSVHKIINMLPFAMYVCFLSARCVVLLKSDKYGMNARLKKLNSTFVNIFFCSRV